MEAYATVLTYAIPGFVLLILIESIAAKMMGMQVNRAMDTISSLCSGMTNTLKSLLGLSVVILSYEWMVNQFALFTIESSLALYVITFIGLDFAGYWSHRFNHTINIMWNRHVIHHSSEEFNLSCALRQTISSFVGVYFFLYIPLAIIGVPVMVIAITSPLHLFAQFWYHTRLIDRMGFLEQIIVTPSHHRVHHAINPIYVDKNYSEIFIIWDKWFGTFQEELKDEAPVYGTLKQSNTWNPIIINFMHVWMLAQDAWRTQNWADKFKIWFMPTGWRPEDVKSKYPVQIVEHVDTRQKYDTPASIPLQAWSWFQLIFHNVLIYFILSNITEFSFQHICLYVIFLMVSIFAFTTVMDKHDLAIPVEVIKTVIGVTILSFLGAWFLMDSIIPGFTIIMSIYLIMSFIMTIYFIKFERSDMPVEVQL